jgi:hypothetical protein
MIVTGGKIDVSVFGELTFITKMRDEILFCLEPPRIAYEVQVDLAITKKLGYRKVNYCLFYLLTRELYCNRHVRTGFA